ncbi:DUF2325 domain-containing protein [uncultured Propionivibrio sp.]|uniref:DUF2325 domain-containing protein n=1 Tax=uncultured Propionivibrio sp. TaxID=426737 RepID=UPI0029C07FE8|nr:DUF2325 domain-containing protein [uncultured Propionivibrio sp.]
MKLPPIPPRPASPFSLFNAVDDAEPTISSPVVAATVSRRRRKIWELDEKHHCPVVGTCLSIDELKKYLSRFIASIDTRNAYEMHVAAVNRVRERAPISEAIHRHLDKKYRVQCLAFEKARTDSEVMALWREYRLRGEVAGALWATVTHPALGIESEQRVFSDIHMLSHQCGAGLAADSRRLSRLEKENADLNARLEALKTREAIREAQLRERSQALADEQSNLLASQSEISRLRQRLDAFESGLVMIELTQKMISLRQANEALVTQAQRAWGFEKSLKEARLESASLARERDLLSIERNALQHMLDAADAGGEEACDKQCSSCELFGSHQCVLYVGGRLSLLSQYRALAKRLGVRLIHHDGGVEESISRLPDMIDSADAVLCPTDCVSHSAYYQVKRQCKRKSKPCLLFKGAGVSGFAIALARLSSGQTSLNDASIDVE